LLEQLPGHYESGYEYKYFVPILVDHDWGSDDSELTELFETSSRALGELNSFSRIVPNVDLFNRLHRMKNEWRIAIQDEY